MEFPIKISVVIPARNRAHILPRCLDSVLGQTYPAAEIIVVDDRSTDNTREVVASYLDRGVIYARLPKGMGAQAARNHGVRIARFEWVAFQDSDDLWLPHKLALQVGVLSSRDFDEAVVVHGDGIKRDESTGLEQPLPVPLTTGHCYRHLLIRPSVMFPALLVSRNAIIKSGGLDDECPSFQEWDTAIRLAKHCEFLHVQQPLFVWIWHAGETISKDYRRHLAGFKYVIDSHRDEIIFHHGARGWRIVCLQNISNALKHGYIDEARSMLEAVSPHTSKVIAAAFTKLGFFPRGGESLLHYAAMLRV